MSQAPLVAELSQRHGEPGWLREMREAAWQQYEAMPSPKLEKTDLTKRTWGFGPFPATVPAEATGDAGAILQSAAEAGMPVAYVRDGVVVRVDATEAVRNLGVVFADLHTAARDYEGVVRKHLGTVVSAAESKWAALNTALWHGGVLVHVPKGVAVKVPFLFVYLETGEGNGAFPRTLVVAEENSSLTLVQVHLVDGGAQPGQVHAGVVEVAAAAAAQVKVAAVSNLAKGPTRFVVNRADVGTDAAVEWVFADVGDGFTVGLVESRLTGTGSRSVLRAMGLGSGRQHLDLTASAVHAGRHTESEIDMRGVLRGRASSCYRGSTHILNGAVAAGSEQRERIMLLDAHARADAIPMLLIDENDVQRCSHAASVGKVDPAQIYYLMSRGIPEAEAVRMIVWGELAPVVEAVPAEGVRRWLAGRIDKELVP